MQAVSAEQSPRLIARWLPQINYIALILAILIIGSVGMQIDRSTDDSAQYWQAARNLRAVGDAYATTPATLTEPGFPNPPLLAYIYLPLSFAERDVSARIWFVMNSVLLAVLLWQGLQLAASQISQRYWGIIILAISCFPATYLCMLLGQLGILLTFCIVMAFRLAGRFPVVGGALLAFAGVIKLYPALFGLYYLLTRQWRLVFAAIVAGIVLVLIPFSLHGIAPYQAYIEKVLFGDFYPYPSEFNLSLHGFFYRLTTPNPYTQSFTGIANLLPVLSGISSVGVAVYCCWQTFMHPAKRLLLLGMWLTAMQLLTPLNGYYNLVALCIPALILLRYLLVLRSIWLYAGCIIATLCLYVSPGWSRRYPAIMPMFYEGWGILLLVPAFYGVILYLILFWRMLHGTDYIEQSE
jgi:Glycosyltransferase family 87